MNEPLTLTLHGHAASEQTQTYVHLPFDVPAGTGRIDVRYEYSDAISSDPHLTNGSTVDIGIFDVRGVEFMTGGFRGWSGSARSSFFIAVDSATLGYLHGEIQPGTWFICLGLYKVPPQGCDYSVTIQLSPAQASVAPLRLLSMSERTLPARADGWYCGEMHCHTVHSDGDSTPAEVVAHAEALGLDFLAMTDHNVLSHLATMSNVETSLLLIPGLEVTTYKGHWNVWGAPQWLDFRIERPDQMAAAVWAAREAGLLISLNHPRPYGPEWAYPEVDDFNCIEVWNGEWALFNDAALAFWEERLRAGRRITAVGGSDCHFYHREHIAKLARPTLWVQCKEDTPVSAADILHAIRAGRVAISESPTGPRLSISADQAHMGDVVRRSEAPQVTAHFSAAAGLTLEWYTQAGCVQQQALAVDTGEVAFIVPPQARYVRAQLTRHTSITSLVCALTNPIYLS